MEIKVVSIKDIKANPNNPRIIKDDKFKKLVKSIQEFPEMLKLRPIVVNEDMVVLGGNMRLKACKEAELTEVPIIKASDLTDEQQKEFIIKDNVGFGEWDWEMIANEWDAQQVSEWGLDIPHFAPMQEERIEDNDKVSFSTLKITFREPEELQSAENDIKELLHKKYPNAICSVNV